MAGIYIHVPFCKQACHYCDFYFSTNTALSEELVKALQAEIHIQRNYLDGSVIRTVYFGGGTPSILGAHELKSILDSVSLNLKVADDAEITLEANPDDLSLVKLQELRSVGFNRLSLGIQSFDNAVLKFLNRAHDSTASSQCIEWARDAGFNNLSIDLIYAIPGQDDETWIKNIDHAVRLNPEHISSYALTIEEKTAFGNWVKKGKLTPQDDEVAAKQLEILMSKLADGGYEHYEISNFCKPGFQSKHNSNYWKQEKYLGIGPSAHSFNLLSRQANVSNNHLYVKAIREGNIPFEIEFLSIENQVNEYLLTTLRTSWGTDLSRLKREFNYDIERTHEVYIKNLMEKRLIQIDADVLTLTNAGKLMADKISSDLFLS